jgi:hypothetical protein
MEGGAVLVEIISGKIPSAQKVVIYGPEGIGKSTLASRFPEPLFIDPEGSTKHMNVNRMRRPSSWSMLLALVTFVRDHPDRCQCKTLVIDTADKAERLCGDAICAKYQKSSIEEFGYGKGYVYLAEEFGRLLNLLDDVIDRGIHVVLVAHAAMRKFEQPDEMGSYDRWELKLEKKTAPMLKEWADMVLFCNYKTYVVNVDGQGTAKGKNKVQGGKRVMYTTHHPCWDAKNRHDLQPELEMDYPQIAHCIPDITTPQTVAQPSPQPPEDDLDISRIPLPEDPPKSEPASAPPTPTPTSAAPTPTPAPAPTIDPDIPKPLADLMAANGVTPDEIRRAVASRGYYPIDTPIANYDPQFVKGCLIGAWPQVYQIIQGLRAS